MGDSELHRIICISKKKYLAIGYVVCPALNFQKVFYNKLGFNHLLRKGKISRTPNQQIRRLMLIDYSIVVLSSSDYFSKYKKSENSIPNAEFWSIEKNIKGKMIKVIVRKVGVDGELHFFSVMD